MIRNLTFAALLAVGTTTSTVHAQDERPIRVVGGTAAPAGEFPWQVALVDPAESNTVRAQFCGGSIIDARWVLTAGHCVWDNDNNRPTPAGDLEVFWGSTDLQNGRRVRVNRVVVHPDYDPADTNNDIALLELTNAINVAPVRLARPETVDERYRPGQTATVSGWGLTRPVRARPSGSSNFVDLLTNQSVSREEALSAFFVRHLQKVDIEIATDSACNAAMGVSVWDYPAMFCAGARQGGRDSCNGDSGGPLHVRDENNEFVQVGVVSWGRIDCAAPGTLGVYAHVAELFDFIERHVDLPEPATPEPEPAPSPAPPAPTPEPEVAAPIAVANARAPRRALLVGIDRYGHPSVSDLIGGSVADARLIRDMLIAEWGFQPDEIVVLENEFATRENILDAFQTWLIDGSTEHAQIVFSYSGHGVFTPDTNGDESDRFDEAIAPHDTRALRAADGSTRFDNLIVDDEFERLIDALSDRDVTMIIDSCHSGTISRSVGSAVALGQSVRSLSVNHNLIYEDPALSRTVYRGENYSDLTGFLENSRRPNVVAWMAVSPRQLAMVDIEDAPDYRGVFTGDFVDGLSSRSADRDGDGLVTHAEQLDYLQRESERYCTNNNTQCTVGLTPHLEAAPDMLHRDVVTRQPALDPVGSVIGHDNSGGVTLAIEPGNSLRVGDRVRFSVSSQHAGQLMVFDVRDDGQVTQLYPNQFAEQNGRSSAISAAETIRIPDAYYGFEFFVEDDVPGTVFAIVSEAAVPAEDLLTQYSDFSPVADPTSFAAHIADRLRGAIRDGEASRTPQWSMTKLDYSVQP